MKIKLTLLIVLAVLLGFNLPISYAQGAGDTQISGTIVGGLRMLTVVPGQANNFVIYRGDYVQLEMPGSESFELAIPELKIEQIFPPQDGEKGYVKMKQTGTFAFTAGAATGTFQVVDYAAASYTELSAADAALIMRNTRPLIIDVRTQMEFQQGYIQGASLLPVQLFQQNIDKLQAYKDQDVLLYCASGNRSTVASRLLIEAGFKKIYNLRHGIADWTQQGYPIVR